MNSIRAGLNEVAGHELRKVITLARLRSMSFGINEFFSGSSKTALFLVFLVIAGILFNFGAEFLTVLGINAGLMYEANPYAMVSWTYTFIEWSLFAVLLLFAVISLRMAKSRPLNMAVFIIFLALVGWLAFDFFHDLALAFQTGLIHWRL